MLPERFRRRVESHICDGTSLETAGIANAISRSYVTKLNKWNKKKFQEERKAVAEAVKKAIQE